jgi:hypothetical protein
MNSTANRGPNLKEERERSIISYFSSQYDDETTKDTIINIKPENGSEEYQNEVKYTLKAHSFVLCQSTLFKKMLFGELEESKRGVGATSQVGDTKQKFMFEINLHWYNPDKSLEKGDVFTIFFQFMYLKFNYNPDLFYGYVLQLHSLAFLSGFNILKKYTSITIESKINESDIFGILDYIYSYRIRNGHDFERIETEFPDKSTYKLFRYCFQYLKVHIIKANIFPHLDLINDEIIYNLLVSRDTVLTLDQKRTLIDDYQEILESNLERKNTLLSTEHGRLLIESFSNRKKDLKKISMRIASDNDSPHTVKEAGIITLNTKNTSTQQMTLFHHMIELTLYFSIGSTKINATSDTKQIIKPPDDSFTIDYTGKTKAVGSNALEIVVYVVSSRGSNRFEISRDLSSNIRISCGSVPLSQGFPVSHEEVNFGIVVTITKRNSENPKHSIKVEDETKTKKVKTSL